MQSREFLFGGDENGNAGVCGAGKRPPNRRLGLTGGSA